MTDESLSDKLSKWFSKWLGRRVTGRTVGELDLILKESIKRLKEEIKFRKQFGQISGAEIEIIWNLIDKEFGPKLTGESK